MIWQQDAATSSRVCAVSDLYDTRDDVFFHVSIHQPVVFKAGLFVNLAGLGYWA